MKATEKSNRFYGSRNSPLHQQGDIYPQAYRERYHDVEADSLDGYTEDETDLPSDLDSASHDPNPPMPQDIRHTAAQNHGSSSGHTSFGERARARPDLAVNTVTSHSTGPSSNNANVVTAASPSQPQRAESVKERSPLQQLETTLGDLSKEEKRARVERAERIAAQRASQQAEHGAAADEMRGTPIHRKPVPQPDHLPERFETLVRDQDRRERSASQASESTPINGNGNYGTLSSQERYQDDTRQAQQGKPMLGHTPSGRDTYDASRTGPAAAAAIDAIQASRWRSQGSSYQQGHQAAGNHSPAATLDPSRSVNPADVNQRMPSSELPQGVSGHHSQSIAQHPHSHEHHRKPEIASGSQHQGQNSHHQGQLPRETQLKDEGDPSRDPVAPNDVRLKDNAGPTFSIPPQTYLGQQARERVGFGNVDPNQHAADHKQEKKHHHHAHFSDILHINNRAERRYVENLSPEDWRTAKIGRLTATDLDLEGQRGNTARLSRDHHQTHNHQRHGQTGFSPALSLKCGPLLRFTGIQSASEGNSTRRFWRGSAMIVTHDNDSDYRTVPVMRIFKQPAKLLHAHDAVQPAADDESDPLVGNVKLGRKGQQLYVRAVHQLASASDLSRVENDEGLFEHSSYSGRDKEVAGRISSIDGEKLQQYSDIPGHRLFAERGVTFWRFLLEVELTEEQERIAYRINGGPALAFWVPSKHQTMNMMFHSCNGFSHDVDKDAFCGPDPLWRDVLSKHQSKPFHCMVGGGDQLYMDCVMQDTKVFKEWIDLKHAERKHSASFDEEMQNELEQFYLDRYAMWFSTGLFGMATSIIPMVNIWDDHDLIDVSVVCPITV